MKKCQPRSLTPFLDGELTEDAWQETEEHLQSCPSCSAQLDELTAASQHVRGMGRAHVPQEALRAAIDVIAPRAGLTPEAMLTQTTEIARARPAAPPIPPLPGMLGPIAPITDDDAWTPAPSEPAVAEIVEPETDDQEPAAEVQKLETELQEPTAELEEPEDETQDPENETQEPAAEVRQFAAEGPEAAADIPEAEAEVLDPAAEIPEAGADVRESALEFDTGGDASWDLPDPEASPTWVQPEPWAQPATPEPAAAVHNAPTPEAPARATPEPPAGAPTPEQAPEVASVDVMPILEEHPPAPPGLIVPAWMDDLPVSQTQLELEGRQAVDDAIGPPGTDAPAPEAAADDLTGPAQGPTSAAEAELRAPVEDLSPADSADDDEPAGLRGTLSRLGAMLRRGTHDQAAVPEPADMSEPAVVSEPAAVSDLAAASDLAAVSGLAAVPDLAAVPEIDEEPVPTAAEPAAAATGEALAEPLETSAAETVDRPEAERLMWIAPRKAAEDEPPEEAATEPVITESEGEPAADEDASNLSGYREALLGARQEPAPRRARLAMPPELGIRIALGAALAVIVLAAAALFVGRSLHPASTAATGPASNHATPGGQATTSPVPSAAPSTATSPAVGQLSEVVSAGAGGTGWTVSRIRLGSPGSGITRVVLDISGSGATPTAQLGRGGDGAVYLIVPGLSITPAMVAGAAPFGVITGVSQAGVDGTSLKFTTSGNPGFSVGYLASPYRLVLDFK